ncbi:MAG: GTP-binding protein, partial [Cyanobacteriota bacterium]|nr:GTP-binding protein [Cyanobacteriota bacterium]
FEPKTLIEKLQALVQEQEIYRIKGFVNVPNKPMRMVLQGVGNRFDSFYDRQWLDDEPRQTRLVFIGRELNFDHVKQAVLT